MLHAATVLQSGALVGAAAALAVGMLAGIVQFGSLWWNVRLYAGGGSSIAALIIQFGRFALLTMVLIWLARCGAMPLLSAGVGILLARAVMVRRLGRAA